MYDASRPFIGSVYNVVPLAGHVLPGPKAGD